MTSYTHYINGTDPKSPVESYNYMLGLNPDGTPFLCNGNPTHFHESGDPVTGTGCLDEGPLPDRS